MGNELRIAGIPVPTGTRNGTHRPSGAILLLESDASYPVPALILSDLSEHARKVSVACTGEIRSAEGGGGF
jgi:hypothetical protein